MAENDQQTETIQQLRDRADQARALEQQNEQIARENAFLKAGINPDDKQLGYFVRGYDGELKPEAIKAAAEEAGFLQGAATTTTTETTEEQEKTPVTTPSEDQLEQDRLSTQVPAETVGAGAQREVDLIDEGFSEFHKAMKSGYERKDAAAHVIGRVIARGVGKE